jgi:hypothetical protein
MARLLASGPAYIKLYLALAPPKGNSWNATSYSDAENPRVSMADPVGSWPDAAKAMAVLTQVTRLRATMVEFSPTTPALKLYHRLAAWLKTPPEKRAAHEEFRDLKQELDECNEMVCADLEGQWKPRRHMFLYHVENSGTGVLDG